MGFDMKEYLVKNQHDEYVLLNDVSCIPEKFAIEIPKGSVKAYLNNSGTINFVNANDDYMNGVTHGEWVDTHRGKHESSGHQLVWQRKSMKDNLITKDYLEKQADGSYVMKSGFAFKDAGWIEIPEGATYYAEDANLGKKGNLFFRLRSNDFKDEAVWLESNWMRACFNVENQKVLWQRSESPNDKLASAEQYRQAEVLPFIDDEPKSEIEQTLAQRQSQYGCFEDVAFVTQGMIELMRKCNYDKMPAPHQMALSMIASKMARIVNGDFNHKDSWHDIGGYAKLIEDEIFDDITEMPF